VSLILNRGRSYKIDVGVPLKLKKIGRPGQYIQIDRDAGIHMAETQCFKTLHVLNVNIHVHWSIAFHHMREIQLNSNKITTHVKQNFIRYSNPGEWQYQTATFLQKNIKDAIERLDEGQFLFCFLLKGLRGKYTTLVSCLGGCEENVAWQ